MSWPKAVSATHVCAALSSAWNAAEKDESLSGLLAGHYHHALIDAFLSAKARQWARASQTEGSLHAFLAMEQRCDSRRVQESLKHLLRSGNWLEENFTGSLARTVFRRYPFVLRAAARQTVTDFTAAQTEENLRRMLTDREFPKRQLLKENLGTVWSVWYVPKAIRSSLSLLLALQPKDEYPQARAMRRHFILHIGGTNTGKTYAGFQRLMRAETGVYLAPLRLLALEAQETLLDAGVDCALSTGEEEDFREEDTHVAATAEKLALLANVTFAPPRKFGKRTYDDKEFCSSLREQAESGRALSAAQIGYLDKMLLKYAAQIPDFEQKREALGLSAAPAPAAAAQLDALIGLFDTITEWRPPTAGIRGRTWDDKDFYTSLRDQYAQSKTLSFKQVSALKRLASAYAAQIPDYAQKAQALGLPAPRAPKAPKAPKEPRS